ncbi:MAG: ORF6N domain-containing protein [Bacteroidetes bacterium]|nr:ORF6N domain-containing protein [Bacteroidota bacterium]
MALIFVNLLLQRYIFSRARSIPDDKKCCVTRNIECFPDDFKFKLTRKEYNSLRSQIGTLERGEHAKYLTMVFTSMGVSQLSAALRSEYAIMVNLQIMRVLNKMQQLLLGYKEIMLKIEKIEKQLMSQDKSIGKHKGNIHLIFNALNHLLSAPEKPRKQIGFRKDKDIDQD